MPVRLDHKILLRTQNSGRYFPDCPSNILRAGPQSGTPVVNQLLGDHSERDPPVPFPNTAVKPLSPDGTARASVWESRKSPGLNSP